MKIKSRIELLWCFIVGIIFSMLPRLFYSGRNDVSQFDLSRWLNNDLDDFGRYGTLDEFLFAFVTTYIIIWLLKKYRKSI